MKMLSEQEMYSCGTTRANRKNWRTEFRKPTVLKLKRGESRKMQHEDVTAVVARQCCSPPFHKFQSPDWWFGHTKNRKRQWRNWNCMSPSHHKLHETYGRCGCKWSETWLLWFWPIFKEMLEIYITFCPKCVSCELFHLIWPDKSSTSTAHRNRQLTFRRKLVRQLIGTFTSRKRTGRKRNSPIGTAFPNLFHTLQKVSGHAKVCALCIEKKKKAPSGRQHINVSSVTFHCAM